MWLQICHGKFIHAKQDKHKKTQIYTGKHVRVMCHPLLAETWEENEVKNKDTGNL